MTGVAADTARWFANAGGYGADAWRGTFGDLIRSGIIYGEGDEGVVYADSSGPQVKVPSFGGWVQGKHGIFTSETTLPIDADASGRIDRVVMRITESTKLFELDVVQGTVGTPPSLTQNSGVWEESLAQVLVDSAVTIAANKVTDERMFVTGPGGIINCLSTNRPAHKRGRKIIERDTQLRERVSDGTDWLWIPGTGSIVGCDLARTSSQTLTTATWTSITLAVENWDHATLHSSTDAHIRPSADAIWQVDGYVQFASQATGDRVIGLDVNASAAFTSGTPSHILRSQAAASGVITRLGFSKQLDLNQGDYVTLCAYHSRGSNLDVEAAGLTARIVGYNV